MSSLPTALKDYTEQFVNKNRKKLRVGAYARVSSDHEDQINSYNNQLEYWKEFIENVTEWQFVGLYADSGISGTNTKKRTDFNKMISESKLGKLDLILTKSVSRFARNTVDCLQYTRLLKQVDIGVYFESDNIFTFDKDGELRLTIMATLAQEESRKISENVKWGHKQAMKKGVVYGNDQILGYNRVNKKLVINEHEASIVKLIFKWYIEEDESLHGIVRRLAKAPYNLTKGKGGGKLDHSAIKRILSQHKYTGDLIQSRYVTIDFLTHKQIFNNEKNYIINQNTHEAIIDKETFYKAQQKLKDNVDKRNKLGIGYSKSAWSGKLYCGCCGNKYRKRTLKNKDGSPRVVYQCYINVNKGTNGCENGSYIREDVLEMIFMEKFSVMITDNSKKKFVENSIKILQKSLSSNNTNKDISFIEKQLEEITDKKEKLLDSWLNKDIRMTKEQYNQKYDKLDTIEQELMQSLKKVENSHIETTNRIKKLEQFYELIKGHIDINSQLFNKNYVKDFVVKIIIDKDKIKFFLINGEFEHDLTTLPKRFKSNINNGYDNILNGGVDSIAHPKRTLNKSNYFKIFEDTYTHIITNPKTTGTNLERQKVYKVEILLCA